MQDAKYYWTQFLATGAPSAYLAYARAARASEPPEATAEQFPDINHSACSTETAHDNQIK